MLGSLGAHYTSEANILKVIRPLFLDDLEAELSACGDAEDELRRFHEKLGRLTFFDPACGCGDFLLVTFRELRRLERETLSKLGAEDGAARRVSADQFYGIELDTVPALIAEAAFPRIVTGNALRIPWSDVLAPRDCSFVLGNPPFAGKHLLDDRRQSDLAHVFAGRGGSLDYVAGWFKLAADYLAENPGARAAFVTTNSITQGEQVPALWPLLHRLGLHLTFAWRTFDWTSEAPRAAQVHVVIIGFAHAPSAPAATLHEYDAEQGTSVARPVPRLNGYLVPAPEIYPAARRVPLVGGIPCVVYGSKPADGGHLLLDAATAAEVRATDPIAAKYLRPLLSTIEFLNGRERFCLWLQDADPADVRASPVLRARLDAVGAFRAASSKPRTRTMAATPGLFAEVRRPAGDFVFVPIHASASRRLIPMGFVSADEDAVVHNSGAYVEDADAVLFGLLQSEMFAAWQRCVGGRIKSDYRFNNRLVYNTFPFPELTSSQSAGIGEAVAEILAARAAHAGSSLAELYHRRSSPPALVKAHRRLDRVIDGAFGRSSEPGESERLELLLAAHARLAA